MQIWILPIAFLMDLLLGDPKELPHPVQGIGWLIDGLERLLDRFLRLHLPGRDHGLVSGESGQQASMALPQQETRVPEQQTPQLQTQQLSEIPPGIGTSSQRHTGRERLAGLILVLLVLFISGASLALAFGFAAWAEKSLGIPPVIRRIISVIVCWQMLAVKSLRQAAMEVYEPLTNGDIPAARRAVSMIVGRDTEHLDAEGITKAAIETVAENASDGVIAPMFWMALLGPMGGLLYKAVNTMDSMIGYRNERYQYFGTAAAKLDDIVNFLPARLAALLMIAASWISDRIVLPGNNRMRATVPAPKQHKRDTVENPVPKRLNRGAQEGPAERKGYPEYDARHALLIWRRDRRKHPSPNSAQTESVCAGALHIRLAGDARYFGVLQHKPTLGDPDRPVEAEDIRRACRLMTAAAWLMLLLSEAWLLAMRMCF